MFGRAALAWLAILVAAILNGAFRDAALVPHLGDPIARALSCLTLSGAIFAVTSLALRWIRPASDADAWSIAAMWLAMTLVFEFGAGHYLFHTPWAQLLADYDVGAGRLWIVVLAATLAAPPMIYRTIARP